MFNRALIALLADDREPTLWKHQMDIVMNLFSPQNQTMFGTLVEISATVRFVTRDDVIPMYAFAVIGWRGNKAMVKDITAKIKQMKGVTDTDTFRIKFAKNVTGLRFW